MKKLIDFTGKKFGRLTVIEYSHTHARYGKRYWLVQCECGNKAIVCGSGLKRGKPQSCGCLRIEAIGRYNRGAKTKHGMTHTRFWGLWMGMKTRCKFDKDYTNIQVCEEWLDSFISFKNDMYESYIEHVSKYGEKETSLDRIDTLKNYSKENCRWVTLLEQGQNRKNVIKVEIEGVTRTLSDWCRLFGIKRSSVHVRINKGMSAQEAILKPMRIRRSI